MHAQVMPFTSLTGATVPTPWTAILRPTGESRAALAI
jgi:hypothetical protein